MPDLDINEIQVYFDEDFTNLTRGFGNCQGCIRQLTILISSEPSERPSLYCQLENSLYTPAVAGSLALKWSDNKPKLNTAKSDRL